MYDPGAQAGCGSRYGVADAIQRIAQRRLYRSYYLPRSDSLMGRPDICWNGRAAVAVYSAVASEVAHLRKIS